MRRTQPTTEFKLRGKGSRNTRGALTQFTLFILVVLFLYWITGGFESW